MQKNLMDSAFARVYFSQDIVINIYFGSEAR